MKLLDEGYVFDAEKAPGPRQVCTFTSLCRLSCGSILASFRLGSRKGSAEANCLLARSSDGGANWEIICDGFEKPLAAEREDIRAAEIAEAKDNVLRVFLTCLDRSDGDTMYNGQSDTIAPSGLATAKSVDGGRTWGDYRLLDTKPAGNPTLTGQTLHLAGKGWLVFFENYEPERPGGPSVHGAHTLLSSDGEEFGSIVNVARHSEDKLFYWDQRQALCPKTGLVASMFWTYDRQKEEDVDIHMAWGNPERLKWEEPFSTGIQGQIAAPIPLADGRLLAFYVHRHCPGSMRLIMSDDAGRSWDQENELVVYESVGGMEPGFDGNEPSDYAAYWEAMTTWTFGHPAAVVLDDGVVLLAYYAGPHDKCLSARWARVGV